MFADGLVVAFSALRAFALSRRWLWSTAIFVLSLAPVVINFYVRSVLEVRLQPTDKVVTKIVFFVSHLSGYIDPVYGCLPNSEPTTATEEAR